MDRAFLKLIRKCSLDGPGMTLLLFGLCSIPGDGKGLEVHWGQGAPKLGVQTALSQPWGVFGGTFYSHTILFLPLQDALLQILDVLGLRAHSKILLCAPLPSGKSCL